MAATSYYWNFGDGRYATEQNPIHTYLMPGAYTVTLDIDDTICGTLRYIFTIYVTDWSYIGGLNVSRTNRCLHFSLKPSQGFGWSQFGGEYFPFPEARVGTLKILDTLEDERQLVLDRGSGQIYEISVRDTFVDAEEAYGGYEIDCRMEFPENVGSALHYFLRSIEHHPEFVAQDENNQGQSDYTAGGFRAAMQVHLALRQDGSVQDTLITRDLPIHGDITFKYDREAHRWQPVLYTTTSEWRLIKMRGYYERIDKAADPDNRIMSEQDYQTALANVVIWCGRQSFPYARNQIAGVLPALTNQATGVAFTGAYNGFVTGPDGRAGSGFAFTATQGLVSASVISLTGDFAVLCWVRGLNGTAILMDQVGGFNVSLVNTVGDNYELRFTDASGNDEDIAVDWNPNDWGLFVVQRNGTLIQMYHNTSLVMSRDLPIHVNYNAVVRIMNNSEGEVFEPRLVNNPLTAGAVQHHHEDVTQHNANSTCALF